MRGNRLKQTRETLGLTQQELADLAGVSLRTITRWEGQSSNEDNLFQVARALNVSADYLLGLTDDPTPPDNDLPPDALELIAAYNRADYARALEIITASMRSSKVSA